MTEPSVLPVPDLATAEGRAHYARSLDCVHCGLCLPVCPTYRLSGLESSSPRGRIYLMRAAADGRLAEKSDAYAEELAFCLVCRACETVCPSGVQFEALMEHARADERRARPLGFALRFLLERVLPSRRWLRTLAAILGPPSRSPLRGWLRSLDARATFFPTIPRRDERRELPALIPAQGERRGRVALLEGCVASQLLADVNHAAARVLSRAGFEVATWKSPSCCGALHAHAGELDFAARLAREHVAAFEASGADWFVHDSAGCGAHVRAFGRLLQHDPAWRERAARVAAASR
ncbi:MAG TPA: 4Fe-4S dicluster domain-containing protein, partial [Planctomycetota bacterium]|nr:4Fe-4S dicluster domain-containing protein [Planctomycetota bacterium]